MRVEAVVTRLEGGQAWVKVMQIAGGCGRCSEPGGCRSDMLGEVLGKPCREYAVDNALSAANGARVAIEVPDGLPLRAAGLAYGLPLLGLLGGASVARLLSGSDLVGAAGAALGLVLACLLVGSKGRRFDTSALRPRLVEILK